MAETSTGIGKKIPVIPQKFLPKHMIGLVRNPLKEVYKMSRTYGDIFLLAFNAYNKILVINHPDMIKQILKDNVEQFSRKNAIGHFDIAGLEEFLGNGIFISEGADWEKQHHLLRRAFSADAIQATIPVIEQELSLLVSDWGNGINHNKGVIAVEKDVHNCLLKIMLQTQVSKDIDYLRKPILDALDGRMKAFSLMEGFKFSIRYNFYKLFGITRSFTRHIPFAAALNTIADEVVNGLVSNRFKAIGVMQLMTDAFHQDAVTKKEMRDMFMNLLFAGFDTTAAALSWSLYAIAEHKEVQEKIVLEQTEILQNKPGKYWNEYEFPYLRNVIKESLRLYPPVWAYIRRSSQAHTIEGYHVPENSYIMISSYAIHRHPEFWPEPEAFNTERFERQQMQGKTYAYIPFGQGMRMCIGSILANMQLQVILAELMQQFSFETISGKKPEIAAELIIKGVKPIQLRIKKRNK